MGLAESFTEQNWFLFILHFIETVVGLATAVFNFLTYEINLTGLPAFTVWQFLGGGFFVVIIIAFLVKVLVPLL